MADFSVQNAHREGYCQVLGGEARAAASILVLGMDA